MDTRTVEELETFASNTSKKILNHRKRSLGRRCKRLLDLVGAGIGVVLLSPMLVAVAALVKLGDGGPVIHRRRVVGSKGEFDAFKFRSMRIDADQILARNEDLRREFEKSYKLQNDPRITRVGAILRKYSLDELPQLFNVLFGDMSLVGPRMITAPELEKYGDRKELLRSVRPGITGYWQVNGRQETSYKDRVEMDGYYVENWSFWLDIKILLQTPLKVFKGEGAY
jgi:lipopolysaccharide/colanic/teichoic acid biosynthesis glycosyltransferase